MILPSTPPLWIALSLMLIAAVMFNGIRSFRQKILHLMLAAVFLLVAADKSGNERFFITLREGETISLDNYVSHRADAHNVDLTLKRFEIEMHTDGRTPRAFRSYLRINGDRPAVLSVNDPLAIGRYRLYQSAYEKHFYFVVNVNDTLYEATFGDTLPSPSGPVALDAYDHRSRRFRMMKNDTAFYVPLETPVVKHHTEWYISPQGEHYSSVIEMAEVSGLRWLLAAGLAYLAVMAWDFWLSHKRRRKK
ncbi:MAG: cytochrome c biogenesis protein ResB [Candidatus Marinimicrobia bacterium]|nr:cytochrome c biogenesis protein ResB [Candidatus Neomarinimicrobiota bacterium]